MRLPASTHRAPCKLASALLASLVWSTTSAASEVWFITDSARPPQGAHAPDRVIKLDAAQRIKAELTTALPNDPRRAESMARQRIRDGGAPLQNRMQVAYQGITDALSLGITTLPAVVVDRRYVVYGEPDVARAVAYIEKHRKAQP